ncbi:MULTISPECIES: carbohydrate ABC transporter permease [unclassified Curtobacterium]|uniref:carbohydrate ABC transporter permease n=1 Tax=unclassified Curtobacterium TaxID=257496 RepID=UPI00052AF33E|nr:MULTISPECIES: sugar ABC transporter permease [unclassified Curtobacterium]AIV39513.1 sugar ABC transporter permease [Curtobacterium sp. MR_MD2014]MBP1301178.1 alpha-glucoside transport system permease protein [Curtobacterium sp. 1310]MCM3505837.1 sugar ABC transporter permease [Curtobacterium sp. ODYSSEY 48 V2]MCM3522174.1 sugar ABC transporter permease [Curtobacterium sp. P97]MDB6426851.1 sugar ABC transporter permease [Curtobacterium sp. 20TX0008]
MQQVLSVLVSVIGGLAVSFLIYLGLNFLVSKTHGKWHGRLLPYVFIGPVLLLLLVFLVVPTVQTVIQSLQKTDQYGLTSFGGLDNYVSLFSTPSFLSTLFNNLLWIIVVPAVVVVIGLLVATLADRLGPKREKTFKSLIFLPMSVSFIAAASMWSFVYAYNAPGQPQVGLLNGIWTAITHQNPIPWLQNDFLRMNSFLLMAVVIWLNAGYAMVLLSAAIKAVPEETIEAARIDGASERQAFFRVIAPQIRTTIIAVGITVLITVMKIFDIVFAMTNGQFDTNVLGVEFYSQFFAFNNPGKASAVVVILILAVVPVIVYQVRTYREQEALR